MASYSQIPKSPSTNKQLLSDAIEGIIIINGLGKALFGCVTTALLVLLSGPAADDKIAWEPQDLCRSQHPAENSARCCFCMYVSIYLSIYLFIHLYLFIYTHHMNHLPSEIPESWNTSVEDGAILLSQGLASGGQLKQLGCF